jgi:hypothetical protein
MRPITFAGIVSLLLASTLSLSGQTIKSPSGHAYESTLPASSDRNSVYVEPVTLTEVYDRMGPSLNIGAVVEDKAYAAGLQKAADVWGFNLDLFVIAKRSERQELVQHLAENGESAIVIQSNDPKESLSEIVGRDRTIVPTRIVRKLDASPFDMGWNTIRSIRADLLAKIPKYDEILPIAFPISPMPDNFFQPSKFPYPRPLIRVARTAESRSATAHAHTSCNMVAQTGNMLHRTSGVDPTLFLMGMEGGNLSLKALPGAVDPERVSAVMTSWVMAIRGTESDKRDILVENDGVQTSFFKPAIHAPEELDIALREWVSEKKITGFSRVGSEEIILRSWNGKDRRLRAGMFLIASGRQVEQPRAQAGVDASGRYAIDFQSTQGFWQQFVEVGVGEPDKNVTNRPEGGLLTASGSTVAHTVGSTLQSLLRPMPQRADEPQPYVMALEGGFLVVTPESPLSKTDWTGKIVRVDLDLRGPLTSDQTITVTLDTGGKHIFRRTVLDFGELDEALGLLKSQGFVQDWKYDGSRGRGLNANVVLQEFLGKHRKFMSSLSTWPTEERPATPVVRFYVDGMQRLNFTFITRAGWRQEFVEVPLQVPPVPRDVELYSGISRIPE